MTRDGGYKWRFDQRQCTRPYGGAPGGHPPRLPSPSPLLAVPNVTAHPSTARVPTSYYLMWQLPLDSKGLISVTIMWR